MKKILILILGIVLISCSKETHNEMIPLELQSELEAFGYSIVHSSKEGTSIQLNQAHLLEYPNMINWALQELPIEDFFNQDMIIYEATVKGHELELVYHEATSTKVWLYTSIMSLLVVLPVPI